MFVFLQENFQDSRTKHYGRKRLAKQQTIYYKKIILRSRMKQSELSFAQQGYLKPPVEKK